MKLRVKLGRNEVVNTPNTDSPRTFATAQSKQTKCTIALAKTANEEYYHLQPGSIPAGIDLEAHLQHRRTHSSAYAIQ